MGDSGLASKFAAAGLVPNAIPVAPKEKLVVTFYKNVEPGDQFHSLDVRPNPKIEFHGEVKDDDFFTLVMVDVDYPRRDKPTDGPFLHWLIPNIKPDPIRKHKATGEQALVGYMPPTPVANSGEHRLLVLLFRHPKKKISQPSVSDRKKFSIKAFMDKHGLTEIAAGTYATVQD